MSKWKPKEGDRFYYLELDKGYSFQIYVDWYRREYNYASKRVKLGNCFRTKAEALSARNKIKEVLKEGE